jgi:uncharacterized protein (TIGR02246 family)
MNKRKWIVMAALAVIALTATFGWAYRPLAQGQPASGDKDQGQPASAEIAAVRKTADDFAKAFNARDAKAVAALWTKDGEYSGPDGEKLHGRAEIEKSYVDLFKAQPKATIEVKIDSVRMLGKYTALEEGTLTVKVPGDNDPGVSAYSVLHVREEDGWRMATVREWLPDPQTLVSAKDVEWLIGEWVGKGEGTELRIKVAWDDDKVFLHGRYTLKRGDRVVSTGTQIIGKNPQGGLRSWTFDSNGSFSESVWEREANRWVIRASGTLPDGSETTAVNVMIPLSKDAYTWQSIQRTAAGTQLPATAPAKVTRVKANP